MKEYSDRINDYLIPFLDDYIFDELSEEHLKKSGNLDILKGVPVPIAKKDLGELSNLKIAHGMAMVIGCNPGFPHRDNYIEYIRRSFGEDFAKPLITEGMEYGEQGNPLRACVCFRAAELISPDNADALFCYGHACKEAYEEGEGEEYVGRFKAESLHAFEQLTIIAPDYPMGFYYLGFGYLNLGLYTKAQLTFKEFLELNDRQRKDPNFKPYLPEQDDALREAELEVEGMLKQLEEAVKIEAGYNFVLSGRYAQGIETLLPYTESEAYKDWWPLYYYLGIAYKEVGMKEEAVVNLKKALKFAPSDIATMEILVDVYKEMGDEELAEKYINKIKVVKRNMEEEKAERNPNLS